MRADHGAPAGGRKKGHKMALSLASLKLFLERNRLGELLVLKGRLSPSQLRVALIQQRVSCAPLGRVLVQQKLVTRRELYKTLGQQWGLRCLTAAMAFAISFSGLSIKEARAADIGDVPAQIRLSPAANPVFAALQSYPALFGSQEKESGNLTPFTKWTEMFARFESEAANTADNGALIKEWKDHLNALRGEPLEIMAREVNNFINNYNYVVDSRNWGQSDYWATPIEFMRRNAGDCEDFAIAKYTALRALGVPEERLRVAVVHDKQKDIPHAVLILYADSGPLVLDNQSKDVLSGKGAGRYRPIFSINRSAWWLHTAPDDGTRVASAAPAAQ